MDAGNYNRESSGSFLQALEEARMVSKGTPEEQLLLRMLYKQASQLAGKEWNVYSPFDTTDEGIEQSAQLMCRYRILLAEILHRNEPKSNP